MTTTQKKEELKEVFCEDCKYYTYMRESGIRKGYHTCLHSDNMITKTAALSKDHTKEFAKCYDVNRINDCAFFIKRIPLWKRFKNWIRKK